MFRQVAEYSITTRQRVGNNSSRPALLAFLLALLLAQFDSENPRIVASSVGAFHSAGIRRCGFGRVHPPVLAPLVAPRNLAPAGEGDSRIFAPAVTRLLMLRLPGCANSTLLHAQHSFRTKRKNMNTTENLTIGRLPDPVFRTVAWCRVWDIPGVKQFSIPAVEPGI